MQNMKCYFKNKAFSDKTLHIKESYEEPNMNEDGYQSTSASLSDNEMSVSPRKYSSTKGKKRKNDQIEQTDKKKKVIDEKVNELPWKWTEDEEAEPCSSSASQVPEKVGNSLSLGEPVTLRFPSLLEEGITSDGFGDDVTPFDDTPIIEEANTIGDAEVEAEKCEDENSENLSEQESSFTSCESHSSEASGDVSETFSSFPVHSVVLASSSLYFETMLSKAGMKETEEKDITIIVKRGRGRYLELLINYFYEADVISNLVVHELVHLLEVADMFLCEEVIAQCLCLLTKSVSSINDCNVISQHLARFQPIDSANTEMWKLLKDKCIEFLIKYFTGVETDHKKQGALNETNFECFMLMLRSGSPFLFHENNLFCFLTRWLSHDIERQIEGNIEELVGTICYKEMTAQYLSQYLHPNHSIYSKWSGWPSWIYRSVGYHAIKDTEGLISGRSNCRCHLVDENVFQNCMVKFRYSEFSNSWNIEPETLVFEGHILSPKLLIDNLDSRHYYISLSIDIDQSEQMEMSDMFYFQYDIAFSLLWMRPLLAIPLFTEGTDFKRFYRHVTRSFSTNSRCELIKFEISSRQLEASKKNGLNSNLVFKSCNVEWPSFVPANWNERLGSLDRN